VITSLEFSAPVHLLSEANLREHWAIKQRRKIQQQQDTYLAMTAALRNRKLQLPCVITLTRVGARMLDPDNLANSFKAVQDAVAKRLGVDDGDQSKVRWVYAQRATGRHEYGLEVKIEAAEAAA
jgi:hypothetical protein